MIGPLPASTKATRRCVQLARSFRETAKTACQSSHNRRHQLTSHRRGRLIQLQLRGCSANHCRHFPDCLTREWAHEQHGYPGLCAPEGRRNHAGEWRHSFRCPRIFRCDADHTRDNSRHFADQFHMQYRVHNVRSRRDLYDRQTRAGCVDQDSKVDARTCTATWRGRGHTDHHLCWRSSAATLVRKWPTESSDGQVSAAARKSNLAVLGLP
jgi:hypothetical protein